ncbi:MAG: two-component system nitrogen regulation response regulator GlnG [Paraglaciecola sp.]|jgi:two-component system nitrogen regulation response regulator GlnG
MSLTSAQKPTLLLIDDDSIIADSLEYMLGEDYHIERAVDRKTSFDLLDRVAHSPTLALVDLGLPPDIHTPDEGLVVIRKISQIHPSTRILVLSGQDSKNHQLQAKEAGAVDFIDMPCDIAQIKARLIKQMKVSGSTNMVRSQLKGMVGSSEPIELLRMQIIQLAESPYPLLIEGESGSGKEVTARHLHLCSSRHTNHFLTLNCAAFTEELLESQLFGHIKGAFTGAINTKKGFFEEVGSGTLMLDEVADLPLDLQAKLLRVLEDGEYYRLGETQPRYATARVLAATNKDIFAAIEKGLFREDLYYRLSVLTIRVPALRERGDDRFELLDYFKQQLSDRVSTFRLDEDALKVWGEYAFLGNVRELRNIIIRLSAKYPGQAIKREVLKLEMTGLRRNNQTGATENWLRKTLYADGFQLDKMLKLVEKNVVDMAMAEHNGNMSKVAQMLGVNRTTLYGRMDRKESKD